MRADNAPRAILIVVMAMILLASQDAVIKLLSFKYPAFQIVWMRFLILPFLAIGLAWHRGVLRSVFKTAIPRLQIFRCCMLMCDMLLFVTAIRLLSLADMHALVATSPLIVIVLSALLLGEKVGPRRWAAVAVGFIGVLIIVRPGLSVFQPGSGLGLAVAFFFSMYIVLTRAVARHDDATTSFFYLAFVGLVVTSAVGPFVWVWPESGDWLWFVFLAALGAAAHLLLIMALELAPASTLQPYNYLLLPVATTIGFFVFDQLPDLWTVVGALIVVGSGLYAFVRERQLAA